MAYTNSKLVSYTRLSPNCSKPRRDTIKKITIHHMAGNLSVETCGELFANRKRQASSNYGIGTDGRIALYVEEKNRSWCSSSAANDNQAITIEVANDEIGGSWHVSDKAYASLINLCVDICKRNGIKELVFTGDASGNLTQHNYFAATACPGEYLKSKFPDIAKEVNRRLNPTTTTTNNSSTTGSKTLYRVRKSWTDSKSQVGAYANYDNAIAAAKKAGAGYSVYDTSGKKVFTVSDSKVNYIVKVDTDYLNIRKGAGTNYEIVGAIEDEGVYTIVEEKSGKGATKWGKLKSGAGWISLDYCKKI